MNNSSLNPLDFNEIAEQIYRQNKEVGWWDNPNRCIYETLQLVSTEIAEATEAERKDLDDDHLPWREGGEVELADALIRILDLGGRYQWTYTKRLPHKMLQFDKIKTVGGHHLVLNIALADLSRAIYHFDPAEHIHREYSYLIDSVLHVADHKGYDVIGAMWEKLEYNRERADHKRENRAKEGGKKF